MLLKFLLKEDFTPRHVNTFYYWLAPCLAMMPAIMTLAVVPSAALCLGVPMVIADINVGILFVFAIASLGVYGIVLAGWASNSKYPFLGGIRSSSQMISYELSLGLCRHSDLPDRRTTEPDRGGAVSDRARLDDRTICRRLDESGEMAARHPDADFVSSSS